MNVAWWRGLQPAEADVECGGATHRVRWADGRLLLIDHGDREAEDALVALGGDASACQRVANRWREHSANPRLVTLGRRPGEGPIGLPKQAPIGDLAAASARIPPSVRVQVAKEMTERSALCDLLTLPGPMVDRLVLTAMASCAERWDDEEFRDEHGLRIGAALSVRGGPSIRRFAERLNAPDPEVVVTPSRPGTGPFFAARLDAGRRPVVAAELPVGWLVDVWGRGISEPQGRLVLAVRDADRSGRELSVDLAEWEQAGPMLWESTGVPARLVLDDDGRWIVRR